MHRTVLLGLFLLLAQVLPLAAQEELPTEQPDQPAATKKVDTVEPLSDRYPYGAKDGTGNYKAVRGMLNPNGTLVLQVLIFVIFLGIMGKLVFKPTIKVLDERHDLIHRNHREAKDFRAKAEAMQKEYDQKLAEVRLEGARLVSERVHASQDKAQAQLSQRQEQLKTAVAAVRSDLVIQMEAQQQEVEREIPQLSKALAAKMLGREL